MSNRFARQGLAKLLQDAALIVVVAILVGMVVNFRLLRHVWSGQVSGVAVSIGGSPDDDPLPMPVSLVELRDLPAGAALLLDARNLDLYQQEHLPAARSLPWGEIESRLEAFRKEVSFQHPLIAYCSGYGCEDSFLLAQRLIAAGYKDVRVFEGGLPEWLDAGLPVEGDSHE